MQLEWKSNARYSENVEDGSIFELKNNDLGISIHKYVGCGDRWFLSCKALGIKAHELFTNDFEKAVETAVDYICIKVSELDYLTDLLAEGEGNIFVRY